MNVNPSPAFLFRILVHSLISSLEYCKENYCVGQTENSLFQDPDIGEQCIAGTDSRLDDLIRQVDPEVEEECEGDMDCITDTVVTGDIKIGKKTLEEEKDMKEHDIQEETEPQMSDMVEEDTDSEAPSSSPKASPSGAPTKAPTGAPTKAPSDSPTDAPTSSPTTLIHRHSE